MELGLDCDDVYHDDVKVKVCELYKKRCMFVVDRAELRSCSLCHLQEQLEKDRIVNSNHIELLHLLGGLAEESYDDVLMMEKEDDTDFDSHDPKYIDFLSHFKRSGKSYVAEFKEENGLHKFIEYEREDDSENEHGFGFKRKIQIDIKGENTEDGGNLTGVQGGYRTKTPTGSVSVPRRSKVAKNSSPGSVSLEKYDFPSRNLCAVKNRLKCDTEWVIVKERKTESQRSSRDLVKSEKVSDLDENYSHLDDVAVKSSRCKSSGEHGTRVEEEEDSCQYLGSPLQKIDYSSFRQKVMSLLSKPYDLEELKKLWHHVNIRKKLSRHRDLRNGREGPYSANEVGKSYLDHYKDLKQKIEAVRNDQCKVLNILRGFFFWLQNLTQEGVFRPWQDAECLAVMPGSCGTFDR